MLFRSLRHAEQRVANLRQRLDDLAQHLLPQPQRLLERLRNQAASLAGKLDSLSPLRVLSRGYAVVQRASDGAVIDSVKKVEPKDELRVRVADGEFKAVVI